MSGYLDYLQQLAKGPNAMNLHHKSGRKHSPSSTLQGRSIQNRLGILTPQ